MKTLAILFVDDNIGMARMMGMRLNREAPNFSITPVGSGQDCLERVKSGKVDCILSDYQMPDMDGMELLLAVRGQGNDIPFIFITGQGSEEVAREAFKNGAYDYFTKDIGFAHFARIINSVEQAVRHRDEERRRREAEYALRESELKYRVLIENSPDMIIRFNLDGGLLFASPSVQRLSGQSFSSYAGLPTVETIFSEQICRFWEKHLRQAVETGKPVESELEFQCPAGPVILNWRLVPEFDEKGRINTILGIAVDITERKKMDQEMLKLEKLESLSLLAGGIAHDFNNLLGGILGCIQLSKRHVKPEKAFLLDEAEDATMRASHLTRQLVTFSKVGVPVKKTSSLNELIRESFAFSLRGSNISPRISLPDDLWRIDADMVQIGQVINNLAINAVQAMPEGGVVDVTCDNLEITGKGTECLRPGIYVRISVCDSGVGIPDEHLTKISDPFYTTKIGGSGLGLATVYSIINKHGGHIDVSPNDGAGTTFTIYLPATLSKTPSDPSEMRHACMKGHGRVLVMDDEHVIRLVLKEMLDFLGYEAEFAVEGRSMLDLYKRALKSGKPFDAVIMDLTIQGGMGGKLGIKKLMDIDPAVKVVVSSGYSKDPIMSNYKDYGFRDVIVKPYTEDVLAETLHKVINGNV